MAGRGEEREKEVRQAVTVVAVASGSAEFNGGQSNIPQVLKLHYLCILVLIKRVHRTKKIINMCWVEVCINAYFQHILFQYILDQVYRKAAPREPENFTENREDENF